MPFKCSLQQYMNVMKPFHKRHHIFPLTLPLARSYWLKVPTLVNQLSHLFNELKTKQIFYSKEATFSTISRVVWCKWIPLRCFLLKMLHSHKHTKVTIIKTDRNSRDERPRIGDLLWFSFENEPPNQIIKFGRSKSF